MKLAASNVDLREEGAGVAVVFVPVKHHISLSAQCSQQFY